MRFQPPIFCLFAGCKSATNLLNRDVKLRNQTRKQWKTTCEDASGYQRVDDAILDDVHNQWPEDLFKKHKTKKTTSWTMAMLRFVWQFESSDVAKPCLICTIHRGSSFGESQAARRSLGGHGWGQDIFGLRKCWNTDPKMDIKMDRGEPEKVRKAIRKSKKACTGTMAYSAGVPVP